LLRRPSALPEFVAFMEAVWPHLDASSLKRQQVDMVQKQLQHLYDILMEVS
jgi:hypothetical protein